MINPFEFANYKDYLRAVIQAPDSRGLLSRLAEAADCQRPYLSKVLQFDSEVQLTPDHLFGICDYLALPQLHADYLKLLLEFERASKPKYKDSIKSQINLLKEQHVNLKNQVGKQQLNPELDPMGIYYSYWLYSALHIAVSVPGLQTVAQLSKKFSLPESVIEMYLQALKKLGLVNYANKKWLWLAGDLHLSKESLSIASHHNNWRFQAVQDIAKRIPESTHYSVVQSISQADFEVIRLKIVDWVKHFQKVVTPSKPEDIVCFNLDFFKL
jgi:hypothetical protein